MEVTLDEQSLADANRNEQTRSRLANLAMLVVDVRRGNSFGFNSERFIGKPTGQIQERVQAVGPEHFGIVATRALQSSTRRLRVAPGPGVWGAPRCVATKKRSS